MLVWLAEYLTQYYSGFNVFSYLTLRAILGILTALMMSLYFGPKLIRALQRMQIGQTVRDDGPQSHLSNGWITYFRGYFYQHIIMGRLV